MRLWTTRQRITENVYRLYVFQNKRKAHLYMASWPVRSYISGNCFHGQNPEMRLKVAKIETSRNPISIAFLEMASNNVACSF